MPQKLATLRTFAIVSLAAILLFAGYVLFYKLGTEPFQDYDEATYAEVTHESIANGNYASLTFLNQPYFRKPPLMFWLASVSERFIPDQEFAIRFPSALAGFLAVILVILICFEAGAGVPASLLAGAVLATTATWIEFARDARFDNLVSFFVAASFYAGMRAVRDARWYVAVGAMLGLAVLSKNVMASFAGVALLAYFLTELGWKGIFALLRERYVWVGAATLLIVAAPWHLYETVRFGAQFWHSYLGTEVLARAHSNLFPGGGNPTNAEYIAYLKSFAAPWSKLFLVSLFGFPFFWKHMPARVRSAYVASVVTVLSVLAVMLMAKTKAFGYLMPMYPFMAVALALVARTLWEKRGKVAMLRAGAAGTLLLAVIAYFIFMGASLTRYDALHINPYYGWELGQAQEEHAVSAIIRTAPDPVVYTYGYDDLGAIEYYSRLPDTPNPFVLIWSASSTLPETGTPFVLATSSLASLSAAFPQHHFTETYSGRFVSLFTVTD